MNLSKNVKVTRLKNAVSAGTSDITDATVVDMQNWDGALFSVAFGTITSGAVTSVKIQESDNSNGSSASDITGASVTVADSDSNKIAMIDVYRPRKRYLVCYVDRGTQNAVVDGISCMQYDGHKKPVTQGSTLVGSAITFAVGA